MLSRGRTASKQCAEFSSFDLNIVISRNATRAMVAHTMNLATDTLVDEVKPFLLRSELVVRSPRGRRLTPAAFDHLGLTAAPEPDDDAQGRLFR